MSQELLAYALREFAGMSDEDFALSLPYWHTRTYKKGEYYNEHRTVCRYLGFVTRGVFRSYIIDTKSEEEKNVFFYSDNQFVVTFKSFIHQIPCDYHTQAMLDAEVICLDIASLNSLYKQSHSWERFGRLLAQEAFTVVMKKAEGFLFRTPEERYLELLNDHPGIFNAIPLYHISSYLGIRGPSLSRIRKRLVR